MKNQTKFVTEEMLDEKLKDIPRMDDLRQIVNDVAKTNETLWEENRIRLNSINDKQDKILGKLENWEIENSVGTEHARELRVQVDDHEDRLKKLEAAKN